MSSTIPTVDISKQSVRQFIIDRDPDCYLGQPDTVLLEDGRTILVAYPQGHGGPDTLLKRSEDGGLTWSDRLPVPESFYGQHNSPTIHRVADRVGVERLILFVSSPEMMQSISEDDGYSWTPLSPIFPKRLQGTMGFKGHAPPKNVLPISGDKILAVYHDHIETEPGKETVAPVKMVSTDGGLTWSDPLSFGQHPKYPGAKPCEPAIIRSPDGQTLFCLARENSRKFRSLSMFSTDEGESWSELEELPITLTGDRHIVRYAPDGRIIATFRDTVKASETHGDFVAWVGSYDDLVHGRDGQYRVRLLENHSKPGDTGYAGLELLPDGTFVSTTYCVLSQGEQPLVVCIRFTLEEIDAMLH